MAKRSSPQGELRQSSLPVEICADRQSWPLCLELTVDPQIFLYEVKLVQDCGFHRRVLPVSYKNACSAVWRQIEPCKAHQDVALQVTWISIATASPGSHYRATLSVRDAGLEIVDGRGFVQNPAWRTCQIGPAEEPTDHGRIDMIIHDVADALQARPAQPKALHHN